MKILNISVKANTIFPKGIDIPFETFDGVRKNNSNHNFFMQAYKIKPSMYSQVLIGLIGLNATGKTSALELISLALRIVVDDDVLSQEVLTKILDKFLSHDNKLELTIKFTHKTKVFLLESVITKNHDKYEFADEVLKQAKLSDYNAKNGVEQFSVLTNRKQVLTENKYFRKDCSIVTTIHEFNECFISNLRWVNNNQALWTGHIDSELVECFDSGIDQVYIDNNQEVPTAKVKFKYDQTESIKSTQDLKDLLSSGTIKGLSMLPGVMKVLKSGGYYIVDELENHFNKKIIDFVMSLFTDSRSNPHGACLIFSTHYPEILDFISRKDDIFVCLRDFDNALTINRFSNFECVNRNDVLKSNIILKNLISGTAPRLKHLNAAREYITNYVIGASSL